MIKLAGPRGARPSDAPYSRRGLSTLRRRCNARRSCTIPRCPRMRSPHVHRERASQNPHATS
eukprot:1156849-Prymnesium_polylepis.1